MATGKLNFVKRGATNPQSREGQQVSELEWWKEHQRLWNQLVPKSGQADTVQGELIRCTGRFSDEAYRNGNVNWDAGHEQMLDFVERTLNQANTFDETQKAKVREAVRSIRESIDGPDLSGHGSALYLLSEMAVRWCLANPKPVPHAKNPDLKR
ncbi:hypothetical protein SAMN05444159_2512 [Bradyrhizobium lablabi]|uniref:Uncharacterized protein n=1 Tax=Bradyrhizobium lablabi TaxID=722472 RepID=A0A1M6PZX4_9BRAD|nr:hypothetical protein [Bradyrhizobium lablabi]SHK13498.1 hypothetical protein SAMN05444159_2512 [Bradyrhizobium lablabi]